MGWVKNSKCGGKEWQIWGISRKQSEQEGMWEVKERGRVMENSLTFLAWAMGKRGAVESVQHSWIWGRGEEERRCIKF